jgi:hypothetical protein
LRNFFVWPNDPHALLLSWKLIVTDNNIVLSIPSEIRSLTTLQALDLRKYIKIAVLFSAQSNAFGAPVCSSLNDF